MRIYDHEVTEAQLAACRARIAQGDFTLATIADFAQAQGVPPWVPSNVDRLRSVTWRLAERLIVEARQAGLVVFKDKTWRKA